MKKLELPHVFVLIGMVITLCALTSYIVPSGSFERQTVTIEGTTRHIVVPGTYRVAEKVIDPTGLVLERPPAEDKAAPTSLHGLLMAVPRGLEKSSDIIFFIFLIGGVFGILQRCGVITGAIHSLLALFAGRDLLLVSVVMLVLAAGGSMLGMGEEFIPLVPIFLLISQRLGYDRIVGFALVCLAAQVGFAAATFNPFTLGVAQSIAQLELYSGLGFRVAFFAVSMTLTLIYVIAYGRKIKADPSRSLVADLPFESNDAAQGELLDGRQTLTLIVCGLLFAVVIWGSTRKGWWMAEMSGVFLLMGVVAAWLCRLPLEVATKSFVKGLEEMVVAALVVGFARGIEIVLSEAQVLDTIIYQASELLRHVPRIVAVQGMFLFQSCLNFLIPSGSGQAAVTMPLMAPLADVLGISRQTAVFAFQCGDGFSNSIIPTSGILMSMLALARIPYGRWLRFMMPLFLLLSLNAMVFLTIAVFSGYN